MAKGMVLIPNRRDWEILDDQTLKRVCDYCGRELDLPHVRDLDTERLFYFGFCQCNARHEIEVLSENEGLLFVCDACGQGFPHADAGYCIGCSKRFCRDCWPHHTDIGPDADSGQKG